MIWGRAETVEEKLAQSLLSPLAIAYGTGNYLRLCSYAAGLLKRKKASVPVISVGNITVGGTGKTPVVIDLAERLIGQGLTPGILSRGYRRRSKEAFSVVSDGKGHFATAADSGDEPAMMARRVPEAVVIAGAKRVLTADVAVSEFGCDVLILDDGFQHIPLLRDLDIVLIDYNDYPEHDRLLPAGRLREPLAALNRATAIIITKVPVAPDLDHLASLKAQIKKYAPEVAVGALRFKPRRLRSQEETFDLEKLRFQSVTAFSGIARPESFRSDLTQLGFNVESFRAFPDHHWYSEKDALEILTEMERRGARFAVTTEKDLIKFPESARERILALGLETEWIETPPQIEQITQLTGRQKARV